MTLRPIGIFHAESKYPYEAPRQGVASTALGEVRLERGFDQALADLEGFERIWLIYQFHHNPEWKPMVMPPRGPRVKRGVFATRAPYRPNALGLSCVRLVKVEDRRVIVEGHDLLDGTPVFDIKPYLPYADAFPTARVGWLEDIEAERWRVSFTERAETRLAWLEARGVSQLRGFIQAQLEFDPLDGKRKRIEGQRLAYRTWRVEFALEEDTRTVRIEAIYSGYKSVDLSTDEDVYADKGLHRAFNEVHP